MSFALTTTQVLRQTKTVTRRLGWRFLKPGDLVQPVKKCQGLKPGERIERIGGPIRIVDVRREPLGLMMLTNDGKKDPAREGFPDMSAGDFVVMFCSHMGLKDIDTLITRIEFEYVEALRG